MQFDIYSFLFVFLSIPVALGLWRVIASALGSVGQPLISSAGQALGGII